MKYLIIIILLSTSIFPQDKLLHDSLSNFKKNTKIENYGLQKEKSIEQVTDIEKYQSLIGSFIGALLASLIAIYSIKKTHKNQILLENEKVFNQRHINEKIYCGHIFSIYSILINHAQISIMLKRELNAFANHVKVTGDLLVEKPFNVFAIDLIKECLLKTLSYENYDSNTILYLVTYVNSLDNFDSNLNLIPLLKVRDKYNDNDSYAKTVKKYFDELLGILNLLDELNDKITKMIYKYLNESKAVNVHDHLETLHNQRLSPTASPDKSG